MPKILNTTNAAGYQEQQKQELHKASKLVRIAAQQTKKNKRVCSLENNETSEKKADKCGTNVVENALSFRGSSEFHN